MSIPRLLLVAFIAAFCARTAPAGDWTTADGTTYRSVKVLKHDAATVTILDAEGGASVPLEKLPADLQKQFDYDPARAREQSAALARKAAQEKNDATALKPAFTLIGAIVETRSNGYYVEVSPSPNAAKRATNPDAHHRAAAVANAVGPGIYFLETRNLYLNGQHVGVVVYSGGTVPDSFGSVQVFTSEPNVIAVGPATKLVPLPPILNQVIFRPGTRNDSFNPGSMKDNVLDNSATSAAPGTGGFNPGSLQSEAIQ